jgi:hypothetical protein
MVQKTAFHGVSLVDRRWAAGHQRGGGGRRRLLQVNARTAAKNIEVEVDKPLGLALGQKPGGGVVITVSPLHLRFHCFLSLFFFHRKGFPRFIDHKVFNSSRQLSSSELARPPQTEKALKDNSATTRIHFFF